MTNKEIKLIILNGVLRNLPKTLDEYERTEQSEYVCDHINNIGINFQDYDITTILTDYIHDRIGHVFSVFEFLGVDSRDPDGYEKAYEYRIGMVNDMIGLVESDQL